LEAPGDFCGDFCTGVVVSIESCEKVRDEPLDTFILCGGVGLAEKMDIVAEFGILEPASVNHAPVDSLVDVRADSLPNLACFDKASWDGTVSEVSLWFKLSDSVFRSIDAGAGVLFSSDVTAAGSSRDVLVLHVSSKE
jgi:hypothetical protein